MENPDPSLVEDPVCWTVASNRLISVCSFCLRKPGRLFRCSDCKQLHYCSQSCQKSDWSEHKTECHRLQALVNAEIPDWVALLSPGFPDDGLRLVARLARKVERGKELSSDGRGLADLAAHAQGIQDAMYARTEFGRFAQLYGIFTGKAVHDTDALLEVCTHCFSWFD